MSTPPDALDDLAPPARFKGVGFLALIPLALAVWLLWPASVAEVHQCGALPEAVEAFEHTRYCQLSGVVESAVVVSMGKEIKGKHGPARYKGVRWFVKLKGADVVAILPADQAEPYAWYVGHGDSLKGFAVSGVGKVFDAMQEQGYGGLGKGLRKTLGMGEGRQLWMFDTQDQPEVR